MTTRNQLKTFKFLSGSALILAAAFAWGLFTYSAEPEQNEPAPTHNEQFQSEYNIFSLPVPENPTFAGEPVPVERSYIRENLDRELLVNTYWQSQTLLFIKRAAKYFPIIEPILKAEGVPDDFKFLALAESALIIRSVSPAGAAGPWQFMKGAGTDYGLEINSQVDERYHIEKATSAASRFLKSSYEKFGSWTLAAAAYNAGRSHVIGQLDRQKTNNYYDLLLNDETGRYVYRIIAIKEILENPVSYGFHVKERDLYYMEPTYTVEVDSTISNFADFAQSFGLSYKELKDLNPWLRDDHLTNSRGKTYHIKIPEEGAFIRSKFQNQTHAASELDEQTQQ
ncbi:lytic transglycosylase domain-containing protein [Marinilabilia sp.]|uniref:lytic transglycosylase domain-containing protein n=1 Tax=Marinilabilia sp. TaxID=2021252 RepID=UPI0025C1BE76|nr:lytic transglycosylase domain-containing protein [Marinilabilia sp.]